MATINSKREKALALLAKADKPTAKVKAGGFTFTFTVTVEPDADAISAAAESDGFKATAGKEAVKGGAGDVTLERGGTFLPGNETGVELINLMVRD